MKILNASVFVTIRKHLYHCGPPLIAHPLKDVVNKEFTSSEVLRHLKLQ